MSGKYSILKDKRTKRKFYNVCSYCDKNKNVKKMRKNNDNNNDNNNNNNNN